MRPTMSLCLLRGIKLLTGSLGLECGMSSSGKGILLTRLAPG
jgi:hypothetical protein